MSSTTASATGARPARRGKGRRKGGPRRKGGKGGGPAGGDARAAPRRRAASKLRMGPAPAIASCRKVTVRQLPPELSASAFELQLQQHMEAGQPPPGPVRVLCFSAGKRVGDDERKTRPAAATVALQDEPAAHAFARWLDGKAFKAVAAVQDALETLEVASDAEKEDKEQEQEQEKEVLEADDSGAEVAALPCTCEIAINRKVAPEGLQAGKASGTLAQDPEFLAFSSLLKHKFPKLPAREKTLEGGAEEVASSSSPPPAPAPSALLRFLQERATKSNKRTLRKRQAGAEDGKKGKAGKPKQNKGKGKGKGSKAPKATPAKDAQQKQQTQQKQQKQQQQQQSAAADGKKKRQPRGKPKATRGKGKGKNKRDGEAGASGVEGGSKPAKPSPSARPGGETKPRNRRRGPAKKPLAAAQQSAS